MKSLILKTLLVISAVTLTSLLALAQEKKKEADPCETWDKDQICDAGDANLQGVGKPVGTTEAKSPECQYPDQRCLKRQTGQVRLRDATAADQKVQQAPKDGAAPAGAPGKR